MYRTVFGFRYKSDQSFKEIMNNVTKLVLKVAVKISMPKTCQRPTKWFNVYAKYLEDHYKVSIFILFLDNLINQLPIRFDERKLWH